MNCFRTFNNIQKFCNSERKANYSVYYYAQQDVISRVGPISKWWPHWMYYNIHSYISHEQVHFAYIKTYQAFLSIASTIEIVSTCGSIAGV